jgi:MFS family permease
MVGAGRHLLGTLMVALDATIINVALPEVQATLHVSVANRQWVVTSYPLPFGGLLLLGGWIADFGRRRRAFLAGLGVGERDSGVASGLVTAAQQVGGSIGTALLNTIAATAASYITAHYSTSPAIQRQVAAYATTHGYSAGFLVAGAVFAAGAVTSLLLVNASAREAAGAGTAAAHG